MKAPKLIKKYVRRGGNRGITLVFIALMLFALLGIVALAIDIGYKYVAWTQLQNAADSAALAGAALLDGTDNTTQSAARTEAANFASSNKVTGQAFSIASDTTNTLTNTNDITVGNWDSTKDPKYQAGRFPINAVEVRARKTANSPGMPIPTFFGKILSIDTMQAQSTAIAEWGGLSTPGFVLCINSCVPNGEGWFSLQDHAPPGATDCMAWSEYSPLPSVDTADLTDLIDGKTSPPFGNNICTTPGFCVTTSNATSPINYLSSKFKDATFDTQHKVIEDGVVKKWWVVIPLVNYSCTVGVSDPNQGCPPYPQGSNDEPYHIYGWMKTAITNTQLTGPNKGVFLTEMSCFICPLSNPWSKAQEGFIHPKLRK